MDPFSRIAVLLKQIEDLEKKKTYSKESFIRQANNILTQINHLTQKRVLEKLSLYSVVPDFMHIDSHTINFVPNVLLKTKIPVDVEKEIEAEENVKVTLTNEELVYFDYVRAKYNFRHRSESNKKNLSSEEQKELVETICWTEFII